MRAKVVRRLIHLLEFPTPTPIFRERNENVSFFSPHTKFIRKHQLIECGGGRGQAPITHIAVTALLLPVELVMFEL